MGDDIEMFSYRELINNRVPAIGIPCKPNNLLVIDVDIPSDQHQYDGREWWNNFSAEKGIPRTYTVRTRKGGYHYYFKIPSGLSPEKVQPPAQLAKGVDVKYNGWVAAPPTAGYTIEYGNLAHIQDIPPALFAEFHKIRTQGPTTTFSDSGVPTFEIHKPYTPKQLEDLKFKIQWLMENGSLDRNEWRDGLFSLKTGIHDTDLLHEYASMWTQNRSFQEGDIEAAISIVERADQFGAIGPGTIFEILKNVALREGAPIEAAPYTKGEIFDRAKVPVQMDSNGNIKIVASETNVSSVVGAMFTLDELHHDTRMDLYKFKGNVYSDVDLVNTLCPMIQSSHSGLGLMNIKKATISGGIDVLMASRRVDPHKQYLESITWDGVPRIDSFFSSYVGAENSEYIRCVSKNFWIALAARGIRAGIKFDSVIVLEGHEGIRKSSLIEVIGGEYTYVPSTSKSFDDLDDLRKMHQAVIVELPELRGIVGQDSNKVKAFLSKSFDNIRGLYARKAMRHPRGFIFVGTTNDKRYLSIDMGQRRFWPVRIPKSVKSIDLNRVKMDRDQLFAEAVHRFKEGEPFYDIPSSIFKGHIAERVVQDPLYQPTLSVLNRSISHTVTVHEVYQSLVVLDFITKGFSKELMKRIESCLRMASYEEFLDVNDGMHKWRKPVVDVGTFL